MDQRQASVTRANDDGETVTPGSGAGHTESPIWRDFRVAPAERVGDLLARMTLAEKAAQLASVWLDSDAPDSDAPAVTPRR